jgi:hypothetical protein
MKIYRRTSAQKPEGMGHFYDFGVYETVSLKRSLNTSKYCFRLRIGFIWVRIWSNGEPCKHSHDPAGYIKGREFLEQLPSQA